MLARNWKHHWLPLCLARSARTVKIGWLMVHPVRSNQNLRVIWKPVNLQDCEWENLCRIIVKTWVGGTSLLETSRSKRLSRSMRSFDPWPLTLDPWPLPLNPQPPKVGISRVCVKASRARPATPSHKHWLFCFCSAGVGCRFQEREAAKKKRKKKEKKSKKNRCQNRPFFFRWRGAGFRSKSLQNPIRHNIKFGTQIWSDAPSHEDSISKSSSGQGMGETWKDFGVEPDESQK